MAQQPAPPSDLGRGIQLFRVGGIRIRLDYSWAIIFLLVLWSLAAGYFPAAVPGRGGGAYWLAGLVATLLLFASILVHELSHALMARRAGIEVPAITLFLFGGVAQMEEEAADAGTEFRIAVVGPLTSLALAAGFWALAGALPPETGTLTRTIVGYLAAINLALAIFNLLPGYPLDGGRILRAVVWWRTGSLRRATRIAANAGQGLALGLIFLGALQIFGGGLVGGLWLILIGLFLRSMAVAGFQSLVIRRALEDVAVEDVMVRDVVTVDRDMPLRTLIDDYFLAYGYHGFPVVSGDHVEGIVSLGDVRNVPEAERGRARVANAMQPLDAAHRIEPDTPLLDAMQRMARGNVDRLLVMRNGTLAGLVTRSAVARLVELRTTLG